MDDVEKVLRADYVAPLDLRGKPSSKYFQYGRGNYPRYDSDSDDSGIFLRPRHARDCTSFEMMWCWVMWIIVGMGILVFCVCMAQQSMWGWGGWGWGHPGGYGCHPSVATGAAVGAGIGLCAASADY